MAKRRHYAEDRARMFLQQGGLCYWCGQETVMQDGYMFTFTVDHIIPLGHMGTNHWRNLVGACRECNKHRDEKWRQIRIVWLASPECPVEPARSDDFSNKLRSILPKG